MIGSSTLLAVHISDGILTPWGWIPFTACAFVLISLASHRLSEAEIPRIGVFTAALFIASQIHVPAVPGVSVHLLLSPVAGVILGFRCVIAIAVAVFLQALLFAHGGLTTWGVNTMSLSVPAVLGGFVFRLALRRWPRRAFAMGLLTGWVTATLTVFYVAAMVYFFGIESRWVAGTILLAHLPVIALEGFITASLAAYISKVKPEWLQTIRPPVSPP